MNNEVIQASDTLPSRLFGSKPESVLEILRNRRLHHYVSKTNFDTHKVALVIEGGALRGICSCGAAQALYDSGFANCFDTVYGTSSGALNSLYFLSGELPTAMSIYYENALDKRCLTIRGYPDILDVDWLMDRWVFGEKAFNLETVLNSSTELLISITNIQTGTARYISSHRDERETLRQAMRATAYSPLLCSGRQIIDGIAYNDGMVAAAIPVEKALEDGCTHIVALLTRPRGYRKEASSSFALIERLRLLKYPAPYRKAYRSRHTTYNAALDRLYSETAELSTLVFAPEPSDYLISNLEHRSKNVRRFGEEAYHRTLTALEEARSPETSFETIARKSHIK